jgi:hypothetical protein
MSFAGEHATEPAKALAAVRGRLNDWNGLNFQLSGYPSPASLAEKLDAAPVMPRRQVTDVRSTSREAYEFN